MQKPAPAMRSLRATRRGWREAIEERATTVAITLKFGRDAAAELRTQMMADSVPLTHTGEDQIGWIRADVWQGMHDILLEQGVLDKPVDMDDVCTVWFLPEVCGEER